MKKDAINNKAIYKAGAITLMAAYIWLILGLPVHSIVHQPEAEEVCLEQENLCHIKLVHADLKNGCEHESHFKEETKSCEICVLLKTVSVQKLADNQQLVPNFETSFQDLDHTIPFSQVLYCVPDYRGPPSIS